MRLLDIMERHGDTRKPSLGGHSQGAAANNCLLRCPEFQRGGKYEGRIGGIFTFGGASFTTSGLNFVAWFDITPWVNPGNWVIAITHPECIRFTPFRWQSPLEAHGFDNPSYQEAVHSVEHPH